MIIDNQEDFITYCKQDINQVINSRIGKKYGKPTIFDVNKFIIILKKDNLEHIKYYDKKLIELDKRFIDKEELKKKIKNKKIDSFNSFSRYTAFKEILKLLEE